MSLVIAKGMLSLSLALVLIVDQGLCKQPVYIGSQMCGKCHSTGGMGQQFEKWLDSKHSGAWESLFGQQAKQIARVSGLLTPPESSMICLGCHAPAALAEPWRVDDSFDVKAGLQCENCHGPGSEYAHRNIMKDTKLAMSRGLTMSDADDCMRCHIEKQSHVSVLGSEPFDVKAALKEIAHPTPRKSQTVNAEAQVLKKKMEQARQRRDEKRALAPVQPVPAEPVYKTPLNLAISPDGQQLYVTCETSDSVAVIDIARRQKITETKVGRRPFAVTFEPSGQRAFVSNRFDDTVSVIDVKLGEVIHAIAVGSEPHGVLTDQHGRYLYVANTSSEDISVIDLQTLKRVKHLPASRGAWAMALSPNGQQMVVTNALSRFSKFREPYVSELTVLNPDQAKVEQRVELANANLVMGVAWHPQGHYALVTLNRTNTLVPMSQLGRGWTITNGLGVLWANGQVDQWLLDEPDLGFADATDVAITPQGDYALVSSATTDRIAVVDLKAMEQFIGKMSLRDRQTILPNHLGTSPQVVATYLALPRSPRGIAIHPKRAEAYVANALDDSVSVIDLKTWTVAARIDLDGPKVMTQARWGEQLFHSADITFQRQFSCHSCHPDGHVDGLTYDIEPDGLGLSPVDNRTLRGINDTAPFKWEGTNPSLKRQCGARLAVFFTRIQPFTPEQLEALDQYIVTIPRPPNRFHKPGEEYTEAQRRGRAMYERTHTNDGREIAKQDRCITCHNPPYYTDRQTHDVGTQYLLDRQGRFDTPHLNNIYDSAPYLHNGMAHTLEEIWTVFNPDDKHGVTNDMTKDQLNDLIEYIKTL